MLVSISFQLFQRWSIELKKKREKEFKFLYINQSLHSYMFQLSYKQQKKIKEKFRHSITTGEHFYTRFHSPLKLILWRWLNYFHRISCQNIIFMPKFHNKNVLNKICKRVKKLLKIIRTNFRWIWIFVLFNNNQILNASLNLY